MVNITCKSFDYYSEPEGTINASGIFDNKSGTYMVYLQIQGNQACMTLEKKKGIEGMEILKEDNYMLKDGISSATPAYAAEVMMNYAQMYFESILDLPA